MRKTILAAIAALILTFGTSCGYIGHNYDHRIDYPHNANTGKLADYVADDF